MKIKKLTQAEKNKLRRKAVEANTVEDWGDDGDNFHEHATPDAVISLLDENAELRQKVRAQSRPDYTLYECDDCGAMWVDEHETRCHCCGEKGTWTAIPVQKVKK